MNKIFWLLIPLILLWGCKEYVADFPVDQTCETIEEWDHPKGPLLQTKLNEMAGVGAPGITMAIYSEEEGWWAGAAGFARIEDQTPMQICHLQYIQSISKTYMAVAVLKLMEQKRLQLDAPMTDYLPAQFSQYISRAEEITVRMLLNHTSGVPEYSFAPRYVAQVLQQPTREFVPEDYLKFIDGKKLDFEPGSRFSYRNTNYVLLALLVDGITGDHARYITESIFVPLGLERTLYRNEPGYLDDPALVNAYFDRYSNGILENISVFQRTNVSSLIGDDGIVCTPMEGIRFLRGLFEGQLLADSTLALMQSWERTEEGDPIYGLGLDHTMFAGEIGYGHSGGGVGAGAQLYYFPEKDLYMFLSINMGTLLESPLTPPIGEVLEELYEGLME